MLDAVVSSAILTYSEEDIPSSSASQKRSDSSQEMSIDNQQEMDDLLLMLEDVQDDPDSESFSGGELLSPINKSVINRPYEECVTHLDKRDDSTYKLRNRQIRNDRDNRTEVVQKIIEKLKKDTARYRHDIFESFNSFPEAPRPSYEHIQMNDYSLVTQKSFSKCRATQVKRWACDCDIPTSEELEEGILPCGFGCINRALNIECSSKCPVADICSNTSFQQQRYAPCEPFYAGPGKGWGLRAIENIFKNDFIIEYVGEVIEFPEFKRRIHKYEKLKQSHHYFMSLGSDTFIDAGTKGNWARFVNHSCEPNCETQKWNVNGLICIGFFSIQDIPAGEEITIDYQFMQYGMKEQPCYCGTKTCSGIMGVTNKQLQEKVRIKDTKNIEKRILKLIALEKLRNADDMTLLLQVMVQECLTQYTRLLLLTLLAVTDNESLLKLFRQYNGLELIASYMVDACKEDWPLKKQILLCLDKIPVTEQKQIHDDSNLMEMVKNWRIDPRHNRPLQESSGASTKSSIDSASPAIIDSPILKPSPFDPEGDDDLQIIGEENISAPVCETQPEPPASAPPMSLEEQLIMIQEIKDLASSIYDRWSGLIYETYRIPRKERQETEKALHMEDSLNNVFAPSSESVSLWASDIATSPVLSKSSRKRKKPKVEHSESRESFRRQFEAQVIEQEQIEKRKYFMDNLSKNIHQLGVEKQIISKALISHVASLQKNIKLLVDAKDEASIDAKYQLESRIKDVSSKLMPLFEAKDTAGLIRFLVEVTDDLDSVIKLFEIIKTDKPVQSQVKNPSPAEPISWKLPKYWTTAICQETNKAYYFNSRTGESLWNPPEGSKPLTKAQVEFQNRVKISFTKEVQSIVLRTLRPFRLANCLTGRITNDQDFLHLAKKLSQSYINKEFDSIINVTVNEIPSAFLSDSSKERLRKYITHYMTSRGAVYHRSYSAS